MKNIKNKTQGFFLISLKILIGYPLGIFSKKCSRLPWKPPKKTRVFPSFLAKFWLGYPLHTFHEKYRIFPWKTQTSQNFPTLNPKFNFSIYFLNLQFETRLKITTSFLGTPSCQCLNHLTKAKISLGTRSFLYHLSMPQKFLRHARLPVPKPPYYATKFLRHNKLPVPKPPYCATKFLRHTIFPVFKPPC